MTAIKNKYLTKGSEDAPLKLEAFLNLACPGSAAFYNYAKEILPTYIENGQIQYIVKLYDKPREELLPGTLVHLALDYSKPEETFQVIDKLYATQPEWRDLPDKEIKALLIREYNQQQEERKENTAISLSITGEAIERDVQGVPTIFINGERKALTFPLQEEQVKTIIEEEVAELK